MTPELEVRASGHPHVRATHRKTLELAREDDITERATCVVGVAAEVDEDALASLRGRVELTIAAGGASAGVRGRMNPAWRPGDPLVVRRAEAVTRDAVVIGADAAASDLGRALVEELASPGAAIEIRFRSLDEPAPGALTVGGANRVGDIEHRIDVECRPAADLVDALDAGERVHIAAGPGAGASLIAAVDAAHDRGHDVLPAAGLDSIHSVLAVAGVPGAAHAVIDARMKRPREVEWAGCVVVTNVPADRIEKWARPAARAGAQRGAVGLDIGTPREQYLPFLLGSPPDIPGARGRTATLAVRIEPQPRTAETTSVSRPEPRTSR